MVSQQGLVRQLMAMPNYQRTELDRMRLIATITQELSFFQHIGSVHVAKLLEQATLQKMHKGDILIKQGAEADCCYIIVNGFTCAYECTDLASEDKLCRLWSKWEAIRSKGEYEVLGTFVRRSGVGYCIGESEVVEKATFRISVVADDEVEVICIPASVYTSVMWDLCDGEPLDVDRIRAILAIPPQEREKDVVDELIEMFEDSDFLSQFPPDVQRQMSEAMSLFDCAEGHLIVRQNSDGDSLFLVISGSVALHKSNETSGASGVEPRAKTTSSQKESACLGPCKRVLGIGDSFGELAFVQGRAHPTASISRSKSTMIVLRRGGMQPHSIARMLSFVANPRSQSMDEVFAKDVSDRNENDILLLINYLEMNPFLKQMAYPIMVDAAHSILRHQVDCGKTLRANPDDEESEVLSETRVFIVNGGSMQVTPKIRGSSISVQWQDMPTVPGQRATFGEQLKLCKESSGHAREENILFSGQLYFGTTRPPESEAAGSKATTPVRLTAIIKSRPVAAFIAGIRRKVFAVNASGIITHTSVKGKDGGMLTEFGSVYEISSIERTSLPKFPYSIRIGIRGNYWIMAGVFRSDCDTFIKVLCDFNPYFDFTFRDPVWVEDQVQMQRDEVGWKNILLRIMADGEVMYSSSLEPQDNSEWLSIGNLHQVEILKRQLPIELTLRIDDSADVRKFLLVYLLPRTPDNREARSHATHPRKQGRTSQKPSFHRFYT